MGISQSQLDHVGQTYHSPRLCHERRLEPSSQLALLVGAPAENEATVRFHNAGVIASCCQHTCLRNGHALGTSFGQMGPRSQLPLLMPAPAQNVPGFRRNTSACMKLTER